MNPPFLGGRVAGRGMGERLLDFTGRTVLITGAGTGIGRATALAFGRQGANVAIGDVDARAEETADLIGRTGAKAFYRDVRCRRRADRTLICFPKE
jgi:NAD(P)-dependent dehydrogenase (short-subunit alcohol dehydrogenase family)